MRIARVLSVAGLLASLILGRPAHAVVLLDTYWGGNHHNYGDSIGGNPFLISSAEITRPNANTLHVVINTAYAGQAGLYGTGYGALFLTPGANAWTPDGPSNSGKYPDDKYEAGEWKYAFVMPGKPNTTSGSGGLYEVANGNVVMSHAPPGYIWRDGQAVQFDPNGSSAIKTGNWSIGPGKIVFDITDDGLLGGSFALSWAMDCGNDVIAGQVNGVPEPSTWAMLVLGFAGVGAAAWRRSRRTAALAPALA